MSDLPTQAEADDLLRGLEHAKGHTAARLRKILNAYASGRLVDREAIDYEVGGQEYHRVINTENGHHTDRTKAQFIIDKALP